MKQFLLVAGEVAQLADSILSACFLSGQPAGSHRDRPALITVEECMV